MSSYTWYGIATTVSWDPRVEMSVPEKSHRKSLLSRNGAKSTRIRPGMAAAYPAADATTREAVECQNGRYRPRPVAFRGPMITRD